MYTCSLNITLLYTTLVCTKAVLESSCNLTLWSSADITGCLTSSHIYSLPCAVCILHHAIENHHVFHENLRSYHCGSVHSRTKFGKTTPPHWKCHSSIGIVTGSDCTWHQSNTPDCYYLQWTILWKLSSRQFTVYHRCRTYVHYNTFHD